MYHLYSPSLSLSHCHSPSPSSLPFPRLPPPYTLSKGNIMLPSFSFSNYLKEKNIKGPYYLTRLTVNRKNKLLSNTCKGVGWS